MTPDTINEIIRLYSAGLISRAALEREVDHRMSNGTASRTARLTVVELRPDADGVWRAAA